MQSVLHDGNGVKLNESWTSILVSLEVIAEFATQMCFPERNVATPPNAAVADVRASGIFDHLRVIGQNRTGREMYLGLGRSKFTINFQEKVLHHRPLKRTLPTRGCCVAILIR